MSVAEHSPELGGPTSRPAFISLKVVMARTGLGRSTVYALAADPDSDFPRQCRLSARRTAWRLSEIEEWERTRPQVVPIGGDFQPRGNVTPLRAGP